MLCTVRQQCVRLTTKYAGNVSSLNSANSVDAAFGRWAEQAAKLGGRDTMLHFRDSRDGSIELTGAHPSGMAQLLAGRATRLSSLVRDSELLADARRRARSIRQKDEQLGYERGIATAQLAIGFASWTKQDKAGRTEFNAPVLLRHVQLVPRGSQVEDYEIVLGDDITINTALREYLEREQGVYIDADSWIASTKERGHGFDPQPVIEKLRAATKAVPGLLVNHRLVISTFANIAQPFTVSDAATDNHVLRALAGDSGARRVLADDSPRSEFNVAAGSSAQGGDGEGLSAGALDEYADWDDRPGDYDGFVYEEYDESGQLVAIDYDDEFDDSEFEAEPDALAQPETPAPDAPDDEESDEQADPRAEVDFEQGTAGSAADAAVGNAAGQTGHGLAGQSNAAAAGDGDTVPAAGVGGTPAPRRRRLTVPGHTGVIRRRRVPLRKHKRRVSATPEQLADRAPQHEFLTVDVDGDQQAVVDAAVDGSSFVVHTPAGTGATQVAVAMATTLAHTGKSVLYVAQSSDALDAFGTRMDAAGVPEFVVDGREDSAGVRKRLIGLINSAERAKKPELGELLDRLNSLRAKLDDHAHALHRERRPWGTSVHSTMEHLARLTGNPAGPSTTVRFGDSVMSLDADAREALRSELLSFSDLGAFTLDVEDTVWFGAKFAGSEDAEAARAVAERAGDAVPRLVDAAEPVLRAAKLNPPRTVGDWGAALTTLSTIKRSLERFTPEIFSQNLDVFIGATGTGDYRREHQVDLGVFERGRVKKAAREFVRPGVTVDDLHAALVAVREQRDAYQRYAAGQTTPVVPDGLDDALAIYRELAADLETLAPILADTPDGGDLAGMLVEEMQARLAALGEDRESLADLPLRTRLEEDLRSAGLGELLDDLRKRRVRHALVADEYDLAYWATVLQQMAGEDPQITGLGADELDRIVAEFREADAEFVAAGAARLNYNHAQAWKKAIFDHKGQAEVIRRELRGEFLHPDVLSAEAPDVLLALAPIWAMSPYQVPEYFVDQEVFDTVILADAALLGEVEAIPAVARARQVIALGDEALMGPRDFSVSVDRRTAEPPTPVESVFSRLADFLPQFQLHTNHRESPLGLAQLLSTQFYEGRVRALPTAADESGLELAYVPDGLGSPDTATGQVESLEVEVQRVVDLVLRHARTRSRQSLAVVTLTPWHAQRVATAIQHAIRAYPYVASFFSGGREPFVVTDAGRVQGIVRDAVIFSIGYGRTLQGRVVYDMGALSEPGGEQQLAAVATRARRKLSVVTCFDPADFDESRLRFGAALLPGFLRAVAAGGKQGVHNAPAQRDALGGRGDAVDDRDGQAAQDTQAAADRQATAGDAKEPAGADPLIDDILSRLEARGLAPVADFAGVDMAIPAGTGPGNGMVLAVEADGPRYALTASLRERERLRPAELEARGWTYQRLWSAAAFVDPQAQADSIYRAWEQQVEERSPQSVLDAARAAAVVVSRQGSRPKVTAGLPVHSYSAADLDAMVEWIQSDGVFRDDAELADQLRRALALRQRALQASDSLGEAVARYRDRQAERRGPGFDGAHGAAATGSGGSAQSTAGGGQDSAAAQDSADAGGPAGRSEPDVPAESSVMPSYDTSVLRDEHLIDAGLRPDEAQAAQPTGDSDGRPAGGDHGDSSENADGDSNEGGGHR